ncbi:uncharacterized protein LOC110018580 [Phalaenopsis equestris]|uniref:uncharacterized protein LOC110018580 n=1 Tax=Phalaenopsis equestris TaxID=78828 RepID=UPI0009E31E62|nr:uncharacterized protein LOC110018580 [Phalaenopsis equestris]
MSSDLSSISLTRTVSSDSNERGDLRHEILPFDLNYEPCEETEGLSIVESMPEIACSPNVRQQAPAAVVAPDSSEKEEEERHRRATNFECNICFDIAKEPVVTSCGHLFCWPCLYLWLHVHSKHKECPVCKGEVTEASITPIYGRGCSRSANENKDEGNSAAGISIPWRPRGNRLESRRQNFDRNSRFVGAEITNSWRLYENDQIHNRSGFIGREYVLMNEMLAGDPSIHTSSRARRLEQGNTEDGPTTMEGRFQREDESVLRDSGTESIPNEIDTGRGAYIFPTIDSLVRIPIAGAGPSADQASASTSMTEIINECSARDDSTEPHSGRSFSPYQRIRRSNSSSSSDDGGNRWTRKRIRLP